MPKMPKSKTVHRITKWDDHVVSLRIFECRVPFTGVVGGGGALLMMFFACLKCKMFPVNVTVRKEAR